MKNKYTAKQEQILDTGRELFWKYGFRRVSIEEICREAGVSKMTFYKYFPNKTALATEILDRVFDESNEKIFLIGEEHENTEATLQRIMNLKFEGSRDISREFIQDLYTNPDEDLQNYFQKKTREVFDAVINLYERGKKDGWVRKDLNIPFMIKFTRQSMDLLTGEGMMDGFSSPQELIMEVTRLFIYGIIPHREMRE